MNQMFLEKLIKFYQKNFPVKGKCRFYPNCSNYFILAIKKYGYLNGILKTLIRILKCNPFSNSKIDFP